VRIQVYLCVEQGSRELFGVCGGMSAEQLMSKQLGMVRGCHQNALPRPLPDVELDAGLFLQVADDAEEIAGLRIAARAEHANEALRLRAGRLAKLLEADRRLDVVAQDGLAGVDIASFLSLAG
jgi:hypothetical protein